LPDRTGRHWPSVEDLKNLAMRSQTILDLHARLVFPRTIPKAERADREKQALIRAVKPYTLLHYPWLSGLYEACRCLERDGIAGGVVECGVWNGGSAGLLARATADRDVWLFDSWEGVPEPGEHDVSRQGSPGRANMFRGSRAKAENLLFDRLGVDRGRLHLVPGWYRETLPAKRGAIGPIALLHLDCDWYASIKLCLELLYAAVVPGGFVFIDDYDYWEGCRRAVDEFFAENGGSPELVPLDARGIHLRKPPR
jgi:O-methyltransferase